MDAPAFAMNTIELLEPLVPPAAVVTYTDIEGDLASSIAAGVMDTGNNGFGNAEGAVIGGGASAKITSILIRGVVAGSGENTTDHFGFASHQIGSFTSLAFRAPLTSGTNVIELSPITGDVTVRDV